MTKNAMDTVRQSVLNSGALEKIIILKQKMRMNNNNGNDDDDNDGINRKEGEEEDSSPVLLSTPSLPLPLLPLPLIPMPTSTLPKSSQSQPQQPQQKPQQQPQPQKHNGELLFTGTGSAIPCKHRNVTGMYLRFHNGNAMLLDVGEGTTG